MIVIRGFVVQKERRTLLLRRNPCCKHNPGLWECPGGRVQDNEDPIEGFHRELREEAGELKLEGNNGFIRQFRFERVIPDGKYQGETCTHIFGIVYVESTPPPSIRINEEEHDAFTWASWYDLTGNFFQHLTPEVQRVFNDPNDVSALLRMKC